MAKTLSESAAEILSASMKAGKEPMNKMNAEIEDLGGATTDNPGGNEIGKEAAASEAEAPVPGGKMAQEGDKKGNPAGTGAGGMTGNVAPAVPMTGNKPAPGVKMEDTEVDSEETLSEEDIAEAKKDWMKKKVKGHMGSMKEDVDALFNGESLSEEFRTKATTIFEAAVQVRVEKIVEDVLEDNDDVLAEAIESIKGELTEQVDEYLNYVVEEWVKDNQVAIETGLRAELAEDFINGLKTLFAEHYVEIPEEKVDVAEELAAKVAELQEAVEAAAAEKATLAEQLNVAKKYEAIRKACVGLTETQVAKLTSLAEGVEFTTEGDFNTKLAVIRENYFPSKTNVTSEVKVIQETSVEQPEVEEITNNLMSHYVKAITKTAPRA
jgi:hypothetical protein